MLSKLSRRGKPISYSRRLFFPYAVFILILLLIVLYQSRSQTSDLFSNGDIRSTSDSADVHDTDPSHPFIQDVNNVDNLLGIKEHKIFKGNLLPSRDLADIVDYDSRADKGLGLLCALKSPIPNPALQSSWSTVDQMRSMGYEEIFLTSRPKYLQLTGMDKFLAGGDIPISAENIQYWGYAHLDEWYKEDSDKWIDWTAANFQNQLDWEDGVIIADNNVSPQYAKPGLGIYPPISQWSDVVYISWITHAPSAAAIRGLKRVVRPNIANDDTKAQVKRAFENSGLKTVPVWPGHRFEIDPLTFIDPNTGLIATPFMAMLGSKNGAGVAYLLLQHKAAMGFKCINAVRVWAEKEWPTTGDETKEDFMEFTPHMSFEIVDIPIRS